MAVLRGTRLIGFKPRTTLAVECITALRKNYAGVGFSYDAARDAFIPPKPFASWVLNESTCLWEAPIAEPKDGAFYSWDEDKQMWTQLVSY